jgi:hypothetical protein
MAFRTLRNIDDVWVYDNPDTNMRELFRQGHLVTYFTAESMNGGSFWRTDYVQEMYYEDMRTLGPWTEAQEFGDRIHKPYNPLATELWRDS